MDFNIPTEFEDDAQRLLDEGLTVYHAKFVTTVRSATDVHPPQGEHVYVSVECQKRVVDSRSRLLPKVPDERFEFGEELVVHAVLGKRGVESVDETEGDEYESGFRECMATFALCEDGVESVRDYGTINLADFVCGMHGVTDTEVVLKLGGSVDLRIECYLQKWEQVATDYKSDELLTELSEHVSNMPKPGHETCDKRRKIEIHKMYGELYKTEYTGGEWREYPVIRTVHSTRELKFWSIEGPFEPEYEAVDGRRVKSGCMAGEVAKCGRMSRLQKFRGWTDMPFFVGGGVCGMDKVCGRKSGLGILCGEEGFEKRISDCSGDGE